MTTWDAAVERARATELRSPNTTIVADVERVDGRSQRWEVRFWLRVRSVDEYLRSAWWRWPVLAVSILATHAICASIDHELARAAWRSFCQ